MELTDQYGWSRVHGVVVGASDHLDVLAELLKERGVLAELQQFPHAHSQISMVLAHRNGHIGEVTWTDDVPELIEGVPVDTLVQELASALDAEVRIGSYAADYLPSAATKPADEDDAGDGKPLAPQEDVFPSTVRMVEISSTPASSAPLFAAIHGSALGSVELAGQQRALYAQMKDGRKGWGFGELPTVTLSHDGDGVTILLVTDDHVEHISSYDWTLNRTLIAGSRDGITAADLPDQLADLVTKRLDLLRIAQAVEGANPHMFTLAALAASQPEDWKVAAAALGLPDSALLFLDGSSALEDLADVEVHPPISVSSAIGRSVDLALDEVSAVHPLWDTYETFVHERPWVLNAAIACEAVAGASLLAYSVVSRTPRHGWKKVAAVAGVAMVVDSIAEFSLTRYLNRRR